MKKEMGACGLLCHECILRRAPFDEEAAKKIRNWFIETEKVEEKLEVREVMNQGPYCEGCHGDIEKHWSPECWILECCVHDKGLRDCSHCEFFPCDQLIEWSKEDEDYTEALDRLKEKRKERKETV